MQISSGESYSVAVYTAEWRKYEIYSGTWRWNGR